MPAQKFSTDLKELPASACNFMGEVELAEAESGKVTPFKMKARTGQPISHWFWGQVVHDMTGLKLHKSKVPIDYCHDPEEVIGYGDTFNASNDGLSVSGSLTPYIDKDRASEVIFKSTLGVPYEASISFGGDNLKVQYIDDGETAEVNGYMLEGPACIIREWDLRGVAVCPYGADMNTETSFNNKSNKINFTLFKNSTNSKDKEIIDMSNSKKDTKSELDNSEGAKAKELSEAPEVAGDQPKAEVKELKDEAPEAPKAVEEVTSLSLDQYRDISKRFGADIAEKAIEEKADFSKALEFGFDKIEAENKRLKSELAKAKEADEGADPSEFTEQKATKKGLFNSGK